MWTPHFATTVSATTCPGVCCSNFLQDAWRRCRAALLVESPLKLTANPRTMPGDKSYCSAHWATEFIACCNIDRCCGPLWCIAERDYSCIWDSLKGSRIYVLTSRCSLPEGTNDPLVPCHCTWPLLGWPRKGHAVLCVFVNILCCEYVHTWPATFGAYRQLWLICIQLSMYHNSAHGPKLLHCWCGRELLSFWRRNYFFNFRYIRYIRYLYFKYIRYLYLLNKYIKCNFGG